MPGLRLYLPAARFEAALLEPSEKQSDEAGSRERESGPPPTMLNIHLVVMVDTGRSGGPHAGSPGAYNKRPQFPVAKAKAGGLSPRAKGKGTVPHRHGKPPPFALRFYHSAS